MVKTVRLILTAFWMRLSRMIRKILRIKNVGLFLDATPEGGVELGDVVTIYAENGMGKTTLAAVLRACADQDPGRINARKTIDSAGSIDISLLVEAGTQTAEATFSGDGWCGPQPSLTVFDSEFVDQNVYSGLEVRPDQRERLLEFALGDEAVQLKQHIDQTARDVAVQTARRAQAERTLTGFAAPYSVPDFIGLGQVRDAAQQIAALNARIEAARSSAQLNARQDPVPLAAIEFEPHAPFATLGTQLEDVEESAEQVVRAHIAKHGKPGLEHWVSQGQEYLSLNECPFCGQSLRGVELIRAYRSYFNIAYTDLKRRISNLEGTVAAELSDDRISRLASAVATNTARIEAWRDRLPLAVPILMTEHLLDALRSVRACLLTLISAKLRAPLEPVGSPNDQQIVASGLATINQAIGTYNSQITTLANATGEFKQALTTEDVSVLQAEIRRLEAAQTRQLPQVVAAVSEFQAASAERARLEERKEEARQRVDALMDATLNRYQETINDLLKPPKFGTQFIIQEMRSTYVGSGNPRSSYVLKLRGQPIPLGGRADTATRPCFATILSDADKRTLAFAFFIAKLKTDPALRGKVVVLDDPISSLDRNRRFVTTELICDLAAQCGQLMLLSHDPFFIRELHDKLGRLKPAPLIPTLHMIRGARAGYSAFSACDLEDVCSSEYYRHYKMLTDYVDGCCGASSRDVAKAIRPTLEGYYHRRFPRRIPRRTLLPEIIRMVRAAVPPDPLVNLQAVVSRLTDINEYASQFHHDTSAAVEAGPPSDAELLSFTKGALDLIYQS
jgi:wobble nucleotide-excising tRNase